MSDHSVDYGTHTIPYRVVRRERHTLAISVLPDMTVEVTAPKTASDAAIRQRVHKRAGWILRQIQFFRQFHPKTPERRHEPGETHLYLGRRYRLRTSKADRKTVRLKGAFIEISTPDHRSPAAIRALLDEWLKRQSRTRFAQRLDHCLQRFAGMPAIAPHGLIVRQLKARWGSMSRSGRLVLNRALIQAAVPEIDYVITHELCHRVHHHHGPEFFELLERVMPDWERRKMSLERRLA